MPDADSNNVAFFDALTSGRADEALAMLEAHPGIADARSEQGVSALMMALYMRRPDVAEAIRSRRDNLDVFECASIGDDERLSSLLHDDAGYARLPSPDGGTALHFACFFGRESAARILLEHDPDLEAVAPAFGGVRPIHSAAASGSAAIVRLLLEAGADPNSKQQGEWTALHSAAKHGNLEMIRTLLEHGADRDVHIDDGPTPKQLAEREGQSEAVELLSSH